MIKLPRPEMEETVIAENSNFEVTNFQKQNKSKSFVRVLMLVFSGIFLLSGIHQFSSQPPSPIPGLLFLSLSLGLGYISVKIGALDSGLDTVPEPKLSLDMLELQLTRDMSDQQKQAFLFEISSKKFKDKTVAYLLNIFLGQFGAHHFYLGNKAKGILYLCLSPLWLSFLLAIFDLFFTGVRVEELNKKIITSAAQKIKLMFP